MKFKKNIRSQQKLNLGMKHYRKSLAANILKRKRYFNKKLRLINMNQNVILTRMI